LIAKKTARTYTDRAADIQEADSDYLARVREMYLDLSGSDPTWSVIRCDGDSGVRSIDEIAEDVWQRICELRRACCRSS
jgi:dTMP kinase